jgi:Uma2 family endonuclease
MSIAEAQPVLSEPIVEKASEETEEVVELGGRPRLWTRDDYYRAAEVGIIRPEEKLELIEGEVIRKVSPQGWPHYKTVRRIAAALEKVFATGHYVAQQAPALVSDVSEPEPDVAVIPGEPDDYQDHPHVRDAVLVVEASDSTLRFDTGRKARLYAKAGVREYWVVSLAERCLYVHRDPSEQGYTSVTKLAEDQNVSPLAAPQAAIKVTDLLPKPAKTPPTDAA